MPHPALLNRLALLWTIATAITLGWLFHWRGFDDPYITFRYAEHIASGQGFVYNRGEPVLSTTTPLYTLLLAVVGMAGLDIPLVSTLLGCVSLALGGFALWHLGQVWQTPLVGAVGLLLYPTFPLLITTLGGETPLYLACILFGLLVSAQQRYTWAALLFALAILTRADGVLAVAAVGTLLLLSRRDAFPWRALVLGVALLLPWFLFAWHFFGEPFPVTLAAKRVQGTLPDSTLFFDGLLSLWYWNVPLYGLFLILAVIGVGYVALSNRAWLPLLLWSALYLAAYTVLGVTSYYWYYAPLVPGLLVLVGLGITALCRYTTRRTLLTPRRAHTLALTIVLLLGVAQGDALLAYRHIPDQRLALYRTAGEWLREHTPADASVGALEVGIIGYYAERRMIDFAGLIQPETTQQLARTRSYAETMRWAINHFRPDYLVLQESLVPHLEADATLASACQPRHSFEDDIYPQRLLVYACWW